MLANIVLLTATENINILAFTFEVLVPKLEDGYL